MAQALTDLTQALSELENAARKVKRVIAEMDEDTLDAFVLNKAIKKEGIGGKGWKTLDEVEKELEEAGAL